VDVEFEIKMQIVCNGTSSRLRKKVLKESNYSLKDMLIDGRKSETCSAQASGMEEKFKESDVQLNQVERKPAQSKCYNCGYFAYPHLDRPCPAANSTCNSYGILGHFSRVCRKKESRRFSKPQIAQESPRQREQLKEPFKSESMRNKRRNRVNKHLDSSTETSFEEDYVYTVENKSDPKTRAKIRVNYVEVNFIVDTGATVDVIDSKTCDRLKSGVKLCKSTTKIFAYGSR
jgi:hypothetical protein